MIVRNKCTKCKHKWRDQPGAFSVTRGRCPKCETRYFKWSSFDFDKKKHFINSDAGGNRGT